LTGPELAWAIGRYTMGLPTRFVTRVHAYGIDRIPAVGGLVYAINHLHWIDVPIVGVTSPRNIDFVAKAEAVRFPWLGATCAGTGRSPCGAARATAMPSA